MNDVFSAPSVTTVADIQKLLTELDPSTKVDSKINIKTNVSGTTESNRPTVEFAVSAEVENSTTRSILLNSLNNILTKDKSIIGNDSIDTLVINGKKMSRIKPINVDRVDNIDSFIERTLGGYRDHIYICWDLDDGYTYRYNVFQHQLTRRKTE